MQSAPQPNRLGDLLLERNAINKEQLAIAIAEQKRRRERQGSVRREPTALGEILVEFDFVDRKQLRKTLQWQQRLRRTTLALAFVTPLLTTACGSAGGSKEEASDPSSTTQSTQMADTANEEPQETEETVNEQNQHDEQAEQNQQGEQNEDSTTTTIAASEQPPEPVEEQPQPEPVEQQSQSAPVQEQAQEPVQDPAPQPEPEPVFASAKLSWTIPQTRENGMELDLSEISGYEILYKKTDDEIHYSLIVDDPTVSEFVVDNLTEGEYEFMIASFDTDGVYSVFTEPVYKAVQ